MYNIKNDQFIVIKEAKIGSVIKKITLWTHKNSFTVKKLDFSSDHSFLTNSKIPRGKRISNWLTCGFSKNVSSKKSLKPWFFVTFKIIIKHIFSENFNKFSHVVQKVWKNALWILAILINFPQCSGIFGITFLQETKNISL